MNRANDDRKSEGTAKLDESPGGTPPAGKNPNDARGDHAKQVKNQEDLGVEADHKTEDMEKGKRGTFP